jgi:hypothetical protein
MPFALGVMVSLFPAVMLNAAVLNCERTMILRAVVEAPVIQITANLMPVMVPVALQNTAEELNRYSVAEAPTVQVTPVNGLPLDE